MRQRWKAWVVGIALAQLLIIGVDAAMLWPSEAEKALARIHEGMTMEEVEGILGGPAYRIMQSLTVSVYEPIQRVGIWKREVGTIIILFYGIVDVDERVCETSFQPASPIPPLTRLRRTLARIIPVLEE
jgi:hypothetical protein